MAVSDIWWNQAPYFYADGDAVATWSLDLWTDKPRTVYAFASLSGIAGGSDDLWCGVSGYLMQFPPEPGNDGKYPVVAGTGQPWGLTPGIFANNVIRVTFGYAAVQASGAAAFQMFGFD